MQLTNNERLYKIKRTCCCIKGNIISKYFKRLTILKEVQKRKETCFFTIRFKLNIQENSRNRLIDH